MALAEYQVQIRDLVMGPGTHYTIPDDFNPFTMNARADQGGKRAWGDGGYSGVEFRDEVVVPIPIRVKDETTSTPGRWLELHQQLVAAFRPIGETVQDIELRFALGGREYVMLGRPRMVNPDTKKIRAGYSYTQAAFVALDPTIYAGVETTFSDIGLPTFTGGLTVPFTVPFTVTGVAASGFVAVTNEGTKETGLILRLDGPVSEPSVTLERADGSFQRLNFDLDLTANQWLDIDTANRLVLLNGTSTRRGSVSGNWPILPEGTHTLRWSSPIYNDIAKLSGRFRSAWH